MSRLPSRQVERNERSVASESITIRFPNGDWEYRVTERVPEIGDTLARQGHTWKVVAVTESLDEHRVITMASAPEDGDGSLRRSSPVAH